MSAPTDHPDAERWWRWRRRFAQAAFVCAIAETGWLLGNGIPEGSAPLIAWSYGLWGAVICAYIGAATWSDVASGR